MSKSRPILRALKQKGFLPFFRCERPVCLKMHYNSMHAAFNGHGCIEELLCKTLCNGSERWRTKITFNYPRMMFCTQNQADHSTFTLLKCIVNHLTCFRTELTNVVSNKKTAPPRLFVPVLRLVRCTCIVCWVPKLVRHCMPITSAGFQINEYSTSNSFTKCRQIIII